MKCVHCGSHHVRKDGKHNGFQRYKCMELGVIIQTEDLKVILSK